MWWLRAGVLSLLIGALSVAGAQTAETPPPAANTQPKPPDPLHRDSPQSSVVSFLEACHAHDYARAWRYLDLRKLPREQRLKDGGRFAQQLADILDHDVQFDVAALSRNPEGSQSGGPLPRRERVDSFTVNGRTVELQLERVTFRSGVQAWLFSADSIAAIPEIARLMSDSPIERHLPGPLVDWEMVGTSLWRWIALALLAAVLPVVSKLVLRLVLALAEPALRRAAPRMDRSVFEMFVGPLRLLLALAVFRAGMAWIGPSPLLHLFLDRGLALLFFFGAAWLCMAILDLIVRRVRAVLEARQSTAYSVLPLASRVVKLAIGFLAMAAVLSNWGYNTSTILAGLGVGGLAIALAAQKTIENLFGGVAVISDRPVSVGDYCRFGDRAGTVEDIGLRSSRIRTVDRTLVTVPNAQFSSMVLENFSKRDKMLFHITLNLRRDTTPDQVRTVLTSIASILTTHTSVETGSMPVRFIGVGTYSLDLEVFAYILTRNNDQFLQLQQDLLLAILDAVEAAGTALAIPTQASVTYSLANAAKTAELQNERSSGNSSGG